MLPISPTTKLENVSKVALDNQVIYHKEGDQVHMPELSSLICNQSRNICSLFFLP